jgi:membrane-associated phospholipid phosphatase
VLLYRRDALAVSAIVGALSNAVFGKILKRVLRQQRPDGAPLADPGMPSSHAMSLYFLSCYLCAAIAAWTPAWAPWQQAAAMLALLGFATSSAVWRVTSGLHTSAQIAVGALLGGTNGVLWFRFTAARMDALSALDAAMAANTSIPAILCAVLISGALIVGSIERKLGAFIAKK